MARLVSYKSKQNDCNQYSSFGNELSSSSPVNSVQGLNDFQCVKDLVKSTARISSVKQLRLNGCASALFACVCCCGWSPFKRRHYKSDSLGDTTHSDGISWCHWCFCAAQDSHDDDIDGRFEQYKNDIRLNELNGLAATASPGESCSSTLKKGDCAKPKTKYIWDWNDSLKSNSDKFLETLEYDDLYGQNSIKRVFRKKPKIRVTSFVQGNSFLGRRNIYMRR